MAYATQASAARTRAEYLDTMMSLETSGPLNKTRVEVDLVVTTCVIAGPIRVLFLYYDRLKRKIADEIPLPALVMGRPPVDEPHLSWTQSR